MQIDCPGSVNFLHSDCADSWTLQALSSQVLFLQSHINLLTVSNLNQILEINLVLLQDLNTYIINLKAPSLSKRPPQIFLPLCPPKNIIWAKELTFRSTKYRICTHNFSANEEISFLQDGENTKLYVMAYFSVHSCTGTAKLIHSRRFEGELFLDVILISQSRENRHRLRSTRRRHAAIYKISRTEITHWTASPFEDSEYFIKTGTH